MDKLTIALIQQSNIKFSNMQVLTSVESHVATVDGIECIFVESILETGLIPFLTRNGYNEVANSNPPSMFKMVV